MVLAERNGEPVRNGKRSRGPSPNLHGSPDSSSEDENGEIMKASGAEKIRVGRDYQAICPELEPIESRKPELIPDRALLVWSPTTDISDLKLDEYIMVSKEKYGYNGEQALGMLFWHKHDLARATLDLANFTPFPDEWTVEDKVLFEQAFQFHGKSFHRIRQMLPDKSIAALVKYYYSWKKTRARTSLMDRGGQGEGKKEKGSSEGGGSEHGGGTSDKELSDGEEKVSGRDGGVKDGEKRCTVCGILCNETTRHNAHRLCKACLEHTRRTGTMRPLCSAGGSRRNRRLPRGVYVNLDDLLELATANRSDQFLRAMDREVIELRRQVQHNKQQLSTLKRKAGDAGSIDELRPSDPQSKMSPRWTNEELLMAVTSVRKYGKDFQAIAETLGNKTEAQVRNFFVSYRRRYNLDAVLKEYETEREQANQGNSNGNKIETAAPEKVEEPSSNGKSENVEDIKDDKQLEVDSEGCALGAPAERGGPPAAPNKLNI